MRPSENLVSITTGSPAVVERLHEGHPVLEADTRHAWESGVVLNPAALLVRGEDELRKLCSAWDLSIRQQTRLIEAGGACVMLYRAQGAVDAGSGIAASSIGLAIFTPGLVLVARHQEPVIAPNAWFHDLGVEDPRCTQVGDIYYLYYTGYGRNDDGTGRVRICLATTRDFLRWEVMGPVSGDVNEVPNKNAALFSEPVSGRWLLLHRPMEGPEAMAIHWAESNHPEGPWTSRGMLMESFRYREFSRSWIGAGGPPLALGEDRYLMIYHLGHYKPDGRREYDLAAALLDLRHEEPVCARIEPLMRPTGPLEQTGDPRLGVDDVLFTCANFRVGDWLIVPYAGADSRIFGASIRIGDLVQALEAAVQNTTM